MQLTLSLANIFHFSWSQIYSMGNTDMFQWFTKYILSETCNWFCDKN